MSLFHCSVSGPHGGGQRPSPLARRFQVDTPNRRWGTPPQRRLLGPKMSTCGVARAGGGGGGQGIEGQRVRRLVLSGTCVGFRQKKGSPRRGAVPHPLWHQVVQRDPRHVPVRRVRIFSATDFPAATASPDTTFRTGNAHATPKSRTRRVEGPGAHCAQPACEAPAAPGARGLLGGDRAETRASRGQHMPGDRRPARARAGVLVTVHAPLPRRLGIEDGGPGAEIHASFLHREAAVVPEACRTAQCRRGQCRTKACRRDGTGHRHSGAGQKHGAMPKWVKAYRLHRNKGPSEVVSRHCYVVALDVRNKEAFVVDPLGLQSSADVTE